MKPDHPQFVPNVLPSEHAYNVGCLPCTISPLSTSAHIHLLFIVDHFYKI